MQLKSWVTIAGFALGGMMMSGSCDRVVAITTVLYDGASEPTRTPDAITNPYLNFASQGGGSQSASGGITTLDTSSSNAIYAGYSNYNSTLSAFVNPSFPVLDNNAGYTLRFTVALNSQTNVSPNRAGFSVIILGSNKQGIEIGFRKTNTQAADIPDIFALNNDTTFTIGEQNNSLGGIILGDPNTYSLAVSGSTYTLMTGSRTLLSGSLRDYSANATTLLAQVYNTPNFLFLGDDTTSARGSENIQDITLITNNATAIPEPSNLPGIGLAIGLGATLKGRLSKIGRKVNKLSK
jgi:hypothetical protein